MVKTEQVAKALLSADLGPALGPYIFGLVFDAVLFGVALQLFISWKTYCSPREKTWVKVLVYFSAVLAVVISGYLLAWIMHLFIYNYGTYKQFLDATWTSWFFLLDNAARVPVSAFFAERAYRMAGRSVFLAALLAALLSTSVACAIVGKVLSDRQDSGRISTEMVADVITTAVIAWSLIRSRTGWRATDRLIKKLLLLVAETQLPPTLMAIIFLAISLANHRSTFLAAFTCAAKIDIICLLVVLNSRYNLRYDIESSLDSRWRENNSGVVSAHRGQAQMIPTIVSVTTETYIHAEGQGSLPATEKHTHTSPQDSVQTLECGSLQQMEGKEKDRVELKL